jgi:hypothetical protein
MKPQNIEQGMQNDEGERQRLLISAFVVPCSIFSGSLDLIHLAALCQRPDWSETPGVRFQQKQGSGLQGVLS